jgi:hypothetical protein
MSLEQDPAPTLEDAQVDQESKEPKVPLRSWRKKYRKLKVRFDKVMDDSTVFFKEERRSLALARRLQEENHQLIDMVHDFCAAGQTSQQFDKILAQFPQYHQSTPIKNPLEHDEPHLYESLRMPHKLYSLHQATTPQDQPHAISDTGPSDYLDPVYEDEYLETLDHQLLDEKTFEDPNMPLEKTRSRILPSDKDLNHQNSDSVLSWLRRHHPESFIQEKDLEAKPEKKPRGSKKAKAGDKEKAADKPTKVEKAPEKIAEKAAEKPIESVEDKPEEVEKPTEIKREAEAEEETVDAEVPEKGKGRKGKQTKEEQAYRPKGGSARGSKRKREDVGEVKTPSRGKRAKGSSTSTPAAPPSAS